MQNRWGYLIAGAFGVIVLCFAVVSGYWESRSAPHRASAALARPTAFDQHQSTERRRARVAEVAPAAAQ